MQPSLLAALVHCSATLWGCRDLVFVESCFAKCTCEATILHPITNYQGVMRTTSSLLWGFELGLMLSSAPPPRLPCPAEASDKSKLRQNSARKRVDSICVTLKLYRTWRKCLVNTAWVLFSLQLLFDTLSEKKWDIKWSQAKSKFNDQNTILPALRPGWAGLAGLAELQRWEESNRSKSVRVRCGR